jgi:hypothetical protein
MPEILRDPVWQFIGAALALVAIIISLFIVRIQRQRKSVSYDILANTPLLTVKEAVKSKLEILYEGKPVKDVHLLLVRIVNTGNLPILPHDYERPIRLDLVGEAQLLSGEVYDTSPKSLRVLPTIDGKSIALPPLLLNSGDAITLKIIASNSGEGVKIDGRIVGVKEIKQFREGQNFYYTIYLSGATLFLIALYGKFILGFSFWLFFILMLIGLIVMSFAMIIPDRKRSKFNLLSSEK